MQERKQNIEMIANGNTSYNHELQSKTVPAFRRLSLLSNQLSANRTGNQYQVQNIEKGEDGIIRIGKNLIGYPITIPYENDKPILQTEQQAKDYQLLKDLFLNPTVMKTSSFNAGKPLEQEQLAPYIKKITRREENANSFHGMYRIYDINLGKDIGVQGMIDIGLKPIYENDKIVESLTFLKPEHLKRGYGRILIDSFFRFFKQELGDHIVYTIKYDNPMTHKICTENHPIHIGMIRDKNNGQGWTNLFTIDSGLAERRSYVNNQLLPIFSHKFDEKQSHTQKLAESREKTSGIGKPKF